MYLWETSSFFEVGASDDTVQELENLKGILADIKNGRCVEDEISFSKSQSSSFSDINGRKSATKEIKNEVEKNGKVVAKVSQKIDLSKDKEEPKSAVTTEIEIPSKGIHQVIKSDENLVVSPDKIEENIDFKRARNGIEKMNRFSEIKYSPHDMAEYIFWTGDEKGVALTIEEFLQEGLMSRQEAITFLQSIKYNLDFMQKHYQSLEKGNDKISNKGRENLKRLEKFIEKPKGTQYNKQQDYRKYAAVDLMNVKSGSPEVTLGDPDVKQISFGDQTNMAKDVSNAQHFSEQKNKSFLKFPSVAKIFEDGPVSDDDYDEIAERLREAGLLQKEYSLEEVIFELAKIMFTESLAKGNTEAQKALQRFSDFLQHQVRHNQISENLQKKILDILSSALMDALTEHPELINRQTDQFVLDQNSPTSEALKQLLMLGDKRPSGQPKSKEDLSKKNPLLEAKKLYVGLK